MCDLDSPWDNGLQEADAARRAHGRGPGLDGAGHRPGSAGTKKTVIRAAGMAVECGSTEPVGATSEMKEGCGNQGPRASCAGDGRAPRLTSMKSLALTRTSGLQEGRGTRHLSVTATVTLVTPADADEVSLEPGRWRRGNRLTHPAVLRLGGDALGFQVKQAETPREERDLPTVTRLLALALGLELRAFSRARGGRRGRLLTQLPLCTSVLALSAGDGCCTRTALLQGAWVFGTSQSI